MSSSDERKEYVKTVTVEQEQRQALLQDTGMERWLQDLMIDDTRLHEHLKGEWQYAVNQLDILTDQSLKDGNINELTAKEIVGNLTLIRQRLDKFLRLQPYDILLSHIIRLSNITEKEAKQLKLKIAIMMGRDFLEMDEDTLELMDINFFDALYIACCNAIDDSRMGWKANTVTEQRKRIVTDFYEGGKKKKGFLGRFF